MDMKERFTHEKSETGADVWQFEISLPAEVTFTVRVKKNPTDLNFWQIISNGLKAITAPTHNGLDEKESAGSSPNLLFAACILIYLLVRLIGLTDYPVYFNFDEADKTVLAADFLRDGFRNYGGELWPAFFPNPGGNYNVGSTAVYVQILPMLLFGRSDFVIRLTVVLLGLIGAICLSLALRDIFRVRYWWAGMLVLSVIPAWFHHSRTGYEMPIFASFYCAMLYFYWCYRAGKKRFIYPAVLFAGLAFYSYAPAQAIVPLTVVALFLLDMPYHFRGGTSTLGGAVLGMVCVIPYIRFQIDHAGSSAQVLSHVSSYWVENISLAEKIAYFLKLYLFHLSPAYWFTPAYDVTPYDGLLHIMKGYGHLGLGLIPIFFWGLWRLIRGLRQTQYRSLLAALLIAPVSASLVTSPSSITRALVMVIPVALIASIGLDDLLQKIAGRFRFNKLIPTLVLAALLCVNSYMLWDVLHNGISWFDNNQANGVQFGASKVFPAIKEEFASNPKTQAVISPEWAMMGDLVSRIYLGDSANVAFHSIYDYDRNMKPIQDDSLFVLTPDEYDFAKTNPKFSDIQIVKIIPYSATKAGFYLLRLKYSSQAQALFDAERIEKRKPLTGEVLIGGQTVKVVYTRNGGTEIQAVFDDNPDSLYKTAEINPAVFDLTFQQPQEFRSIFIIHGAANIELIATFFSDSGEPIKTYTIPFVGSFDKGSTFRFDETVKSSRVTISVRGVDSNEDSLIHIWQISFNK